MALNGDFGFKKNYNEIALRLRHPVKGKICVIVSSMTRVSHLSRTGLLVLGITRKQLGHKHSSQPKMIINDSS